jgi:GNAT superfamily N-acetyltransferase
MEPDVIIREATLADGPVLAKIERNSPLVFADGGSLAIDRGDDYFAAARLMGGATVLLAEVDGEPAGAICGAIHRVLLGGAERRMLYVHHARILPQYQNTGLGRRISPALMERCKAEGYDSPYWYIAPGNARSQSFARNSPGKWSFGPNWIAMSCPENAGPAFGRPATPGDANEIVHILNACHDGEEMFLPYTAESFAERLAHDPRQYGWENIWLGDGAVAGVWPEGNWISLRHTDPAGNMSVSRGAAVLDYGFLPGAGEELRSLLRAWSSWLAERGMVELTAFTSRNTRAWPVFEGMKGELSSFDIWTPNLPEPEGASSRGLYVDHLYF